MSSILDQDIMYLPGVGPKKKAILVNELGVSSWRDLLETYPYKYVDRRKIYYIDELNGQMPFVQIKGKILSFEERSEEHTSELQSRQYLVCRLLLEKKKTYT